ncbi:unnamed protein product [Caenorhabditis angaria]|uniref:Transmembrane protein n=1 Tax=Caenorhabditis angaria TaxID=860376 RepID=A0A9P1I694_9PELO|nr:unnamed protein product [Caenorhabditis angaria]
MDAKTISTSKIAHKNERNQSIIVGVMVLVSILLVGAVMFLILFIQSDAGLCENRDLYLSNINIFSWIMCGVYGLLCWLSWLMYSIADSKIEAKQEEKNGKKSSDVSANSMKL